MGTYDAIGVPVSGQPVSSSLFGVAVRNAILDIDARLLKAEVDQQRVLARGRRTTASSSITTAEIGVMRLDNIPVVAGYMYRISTSAINFDITGSTAGGEVIAAIIRAEFSATLPAAGATNTSAMLGQTRTNTITDTTNGPILPVSVFYYASTTGYISVRLSASRPSGANACQLFANASNPIDMVIEYAGVDPGDTAVII
jgi:hypothetical protein